MKRVAVVAAVLLLAGCGSSPPTQHYTLDPVPARQPAAAVSGTPIKVVAVHIPSSLDREEMVREGADHKVEVSDQNRWSAPLDQMIQRVLTEDLAQRLPPGMVVLPQEPARGPVRQIVLDILQFAPVGNAVSFDGSWSLLRAGSENAELNRPVHLTETAASGSYADQVGAMSRVVGQIADQIAIVLPSAGTGADPGSRKRR